MLTMARKVKPAPPTPGELWRQQQRAIRHPWNDPRLRALLDEARKTAEAGRNLLSPQAREILRLMREQREVLRRLGIGDEPPLPPSLQPIAAAGEDQARASGLYSPARRSRPA